MLLNTCVEALTNKLFFDILKMETLKGNEFIDTKIAKNSKSVHPAIYIMCKMYNKHIITLNFAEPL